MQAYTGQQFLIAALEALGFDGLTCQAAQRKGMVIIMKKFISSLLVLLFCLSLGADAVNVSTTEGTRNENGLSPFVVWDGQIYPMTAEEFVLFETNPEAFAFYNQGVINDTPTTSAYRSYYRSAAGYPKDYRDSSYQTYITPCMGGGAGGAALALNLSFSQTISYSQGGSLSASCKNMITATLNAQVTQSLTRFSGTTYTINIPANQYMKLSFTPRVKEVRGTFHKEWDQVGGTIREVETPVSAKFFVINGNLPDGAYNPICKSYSW